MSKAILLSIGRPGARLDQQKWVVHAETRDRARKNAQREQEARSSGPVDGFAIRSRPRAAAPHKSLRASASAPKWSGLVAAKRPRGASGPPRGTGASSA